MTTYVQADCIFHGRKENGMKESKHMHISFNRYTFQLTYSFLQDRKTCSISYSDNIKNMIALQYNL